jgi:uncharacterized membrane protein
MDNPASLPDHIEETVKLIADFHDEHRARVSPLGRAAQKATAIVSRPVTLLIGLLLIAGWMVGNWVAVRLQVQSLDPPPFAILELVGTLAALLLAGLILVTQRHNDQLAEQRAQLTLQLALLSEQKTAKLIALIEELRRDLPAVADRPDPISAAMAEPADARTVLNAIRSEAGSAHADGAD